MPLSRRTRITALILILASFIASTEGNGSDPALRPDDMRQWLAYLASDELQGRALHSSGLGIATAYITEHLRQWKLRPAGDAGGFLQTVRIVHVKSDNRSRITVTVGGERRTFTDRAGVVFPRNVGGPQRVTVDRVEFLGYGLDAPLVGHDDLRGVDVRGTATVWLGREGPQGLPMPQYRRLLAGRARALTDQAGAAMSIGPITPAAPATPPSPDRPGDFTTVQRLDTQLPPLLGGGDEFFEFLFSRAPVPYAELKRLAAEQSPLPRFRLDGVSITVDLDARYQVVRTELAQNIVAVVDGSDTAQRQTYVGLSAHYDHVGYAPDELVVTAQGPSRPGAPGLMTPAAAADRIWNGADDNASGTVALMAMARAFAAAPPKRSVLFIWHTGEERGLLGSRYFADFPTVPLGRMEALINLDMVGRNRDDRPSEARTVYVVGSDRISSDLDMVVRAANARLHEPMVLDYELNDPTDLEQLYYRSDHFSYAAKGIPAVFYTTGPHADYHTNTDDPDRIDYGKLTRVTRLVYETARTLAMREQPLRRDNLGPRSGRTVRVGAAPGR